MGSPNTLPIAAGGPPPPPQAGPLEDRDLCSLVESSGASTGQAQWALASALAALAQPMPEAGSASQARAAGRAQRPYSSQNLDWVGALVYLQGCR